MRIPTRLLVILLALTSVNVLADLKSKQEISDEAKAKAPHITTEQLSGYLTIKANIVLLDIRTEAEYEAGHIQGAKWLPRGKLEYEMQETVSDPDARIVLYCGSGARSALAALTLLDMGYTNVVDVDGGFKAWVSAGNPIYNMHGELKVLEYKKPE